MPVLAKVVIDVATNALDEAFTYLAPDDGCVDGQPVKVGCAVVVPLGKKRAIGFVIELTQVDNLSAVDLGFSPDKLKSLISVASDSFFNEDATWLAQKMASYYVAPLSTSVRLFTPPGAIPKVVKSAQGAWVVEKPAIGEVDDRWLVPGPAFDTFVPKKNATKQRELLKVLAQGPIRMAELTIEFGDVSDPIKALVKERAAVVEYRRMYRGVPEASFDAFDASVVDDFVPFVPSPKPPLTQGQSQALGIIREAYDQHKGHVVLLDGVTGSGKTEVYLQAIEYVLNRGENALVLVPEISLTPQTVARFRGRFGNTVAVMHSKMSQGERYDQWDLIKNGKARVVVGARSALFTPLSHVGLIVIDEEHENSYKQDQAPRYNAIYVAQWMIKRKGATLVLGSATPSFESLHACQVNPLWHHAVLAERANGKPMPPIEVVDMTADFKGGARSMFSSRLLQETHDALLAGNKVVLLLNQRGFAKFVMCRECGYVPGCSSCSTSLTYHETNKKLICHHCGYTQDLPRVCPQCGGVYLMKYGYGTQQVESFLRTWLASQDDLGDIPIIRMDADTTAHKGAHQKLLETFAEGRASILLGTQMIAKGLDFDSVTLVGVINADTQLHLPDYRSQERTFDLIEQVAGRAGRALLDGKVLVQTYQANELVIQAAARYDRATFLAHEMENRALLHYPPFVRLANVLLWGNDEAAVAAEAKKVHADLQEIIPSSGADNGLWELLPPCPCVLTKLRSSYRYHILIKMPPRVDASKVVGAYLRGRAINPRVSVAIDIDPLDLL